MNKNNKIIKGAGGASDLLNKEDDSALLWWEVCSPELARVILEFEDCLIGMTFLLSQVTNMNTMNLSTSDFPLILTD